VANAVTKAGSWFEGWPRGLRPRLCTSECSLSSSKACGGLSSRLGPRPQHEDWPLPNHQAGQPALVYIVPSLLLASAGTAVVRGELDELLQFKSPRAARAKEQLEARKAEREAERAKEQAGSLK
jgi:hypothetical protein